MRFFRFIFNDGEWVNCFGKLYCEKEYYREVTVSENAIEWVEEGERTGNAIVWVKGKRMITKIPYQRFMDEIGATIKEIRR